MTSPRTGENSGLNKMKTDVVAVYRQEQDARTEAPTFYVTREEARTLKKLNQGFFINCGQDMRLIESVEVVFKVGDENDIRFRSSTESRMIKPATVARAIGEDKIKAKRKPLRQRSQITPFDFLRGRMRPMAVVAVESWA
jgi:hypothetical protein